MEDDDSESAEATRQPSAALPARLSFLDHARPAGSTFPPPPPPPHKEHRPARQRKPSLHGNPPPGYAWVEASEVLTEIRWTICDDQVARPVFRHVPESRNCEEAAAADQAREEYVRPKATLPYPRAFGAALGFGIGAGTCGGVRANFSICCCTRRDVTRGDGRKGGGCTRGLARAVQKQRAHFQGPRLHLLRKSLLLPSRGYLQDRRLKQKNIEQDVAVKMRATHEQQQERKTCKVPKQTFNLHKRLMTGIQSISQ